MSGIRSFAFEEIGDFNFGFYSSPDDRSSIKSNFDITSIRLKGRLSNKEQFVYRRTNRYSMGNLKAPVLTIDYTHSFDNVLGGDFKFDKIGFELWQFNSFGNWGTFEYTIKSLSNIWRSTLPLTVYYARQPVFL